MSVDKVKTRIQVDFFEFQVGTPLIATIIFGIASFFGMFSITRSISVLLLVIPLNDWVDPSYAARGKIVRILRTR
jgi:hypothetical protein